MEASEECYDGCSSRQHRDELTSVILNSLLTDQEVATFMSWKCGNYFAWRNSAGQSLVHVTAAAGRLQLLRLLLHLRHCINEQDEDSFYTPLHYSLLHGQIHCAVRLIQLGANIDVMDNDFLTPAEGVMVDCKYRFKDNCNSVANELYVWGGNTNYNLGCGHNNERLTPEIHDFFAKLGIPVIKVAMEKFHSIFLTPSEVWGCGLGSRAGLGAEATVLIPQRLAIKAKSKIIDVSVSEHHTVLLTSVGTAFTCGLNTYGALGIPQCPPVLLSPKAVHGLPYLSGVLAADYHSVFYSKIQLFMCGTNVGQMGSGSPGEVLDRPREVTTLKLKDIINIISAATSSGATVILTSEGTVYLLSNFKCLRITPRTWLLRSLKVAVIGGTSLPNIPEVELKVCLLSENNILYLWRASTSEFRPCSWTIKREIRPTDFSLTTNGIIFTTNYGEAYTSFFKDSKKGKQIELLEVRRLPHIHRSYSIFSDWKGRNFCILQRSPKAFYSQIKSKVDDTKLNSLGEDLQNLLEESHEDDNIHDIVFQVKGKNYPLHKYIVFHANSQTRMSKICGENDDDSKLKVIVIDNMTNESFEKVLNYIYSFKLKNLHLRETELDEEISAYEAHMINRLELSEVADIRYAARKLGINGLLPNNMVSSSIPSLTRRNGTFDLSLIAQDGQIVRAHKCIVVARSEFFKVMLTHGWRESGETKLLVPLSGRVLEVFVDFLYTDASKELENSLDLDFISQVLVSADQLLCEGLKRIAAEAMIRLMNLRNAPDIFQLAATCQTPYLKSHAQLFIIANLSAFLESRLLEILPDERLEELSEAYGRILLPRRRWTKTDITEVAIVRSIVDSLPNVLKEDDLEIAKQSIKTDPKRKRERKTSERKSRLSADPTEECLVSPPPKVEVELQSHLQPNLVEENFTAANTSPHSERIARRLKVITENAHSPLPSESLTVLRTSLAATSLKDFPELQGSSTGKTPPKALAPVAEGSKKFTKLSQRERKRLNSVESDSSINTVTPVKSPWAVIPPPLNQLEDKNNKPQMNEIIDLEKAEKEKAARLRSKPLSLTQIEDKALHELELFYNVSEVTDERITVGRLLSSSSVASPVWPVNKWR